MFLFQDITEKIIGCAVSVHKELGPGFLESIYQEAMAYELARQKVSFGKEVPVNITYKGRIVGFHKIDLLVEDKIVVELKAVKSLDDIHFVTVRSYLRATRLKVALIINFSTLTITVKRVLRDKSLLTGEKGNLGEGKFFKIDPIGFISDNMPMTTQLDSQGCGSNGSESSLPD